MPQSVKKGGPVSAPLAGPPPGFQRFVMVFDVSDTWIADGFDPDDEGAQRMIEARLPHARGTEVRGAMLTRPPRDEVARLMGYKDDAERIAYGNWGRK